MPPRLDSTTPASPAPPFAALGSPALGSPTLGSPTLGSDAASAVRTLTGATEAANASHALFPGESAVPVLPVVAVSVGVHVLVALALGALGVAPALALRTESFVELSVSVPVEPAALPEPAAPPPEPAAVAPPPTLRERPRPEEAPPPERPPEPTAAPPSLDEVFGDDPAPPAEVMTAEGAGGFAIDPGVPGGVPGGRAGGTGEGVGSAGTAAPVPAGSSEADRRRARRAYVRSLEGLLHGRTRYPRALERAGVGGRVELCIRVGDDGRVLGTRVCGTAGQAQLDEAALSAANELDRVPAPPALAAWSPSDEIHAGIVFAVR